jgi:hypothetical protein
MKYLLWVTDEIKIYPVIEMKLVDKKFQIFKEYFLRRESARGTSQLRNQSMID